MVLRVQNGRRRYHARSALCTRGTAMLDALSLFFINQGFLPHGYCLSWSPPLLWTYVLSNAAIGIAYFTIPMALLTLLRKREDLRYHRMVQMFAAFILLCGTTHF